MDAGYGDGRTGGNFRTFEYVTGTSPAVMTGMVGASVYAATSGLFGLQTMVLMLALQLAVSALFLLAYLKGCPAE